MNFFWILWTFDALIALVALYFFLTGLSDGTVSEFNIKTWVLLLLVPFLILGGSYWCYTQGHMKLAKGLLYILAIPGFLYLFFLAVVLLTKQKWN